MIPCALVFIYGIFLSYVNCEFGIAPEHQQPLTKLLKKTISHVKSFLGVFEKKIKDSRVIVREIHNQSLLSNNYSTTAPIADNAIGQSNFRNQDTKFRQGEDEYDYANKYTMDGMDKPDYEFIGRPPVHKSPNRRLIVAQRRATSMKPIRNFMRNSISRFNIEKELNPRQDWLKTEGFRTTLAVKIIETSTKHLKRLMRQGPARFQSQELYDSKGNTKSPILFFKGFKFYNNFTKHPKRLIGPAMFQSEESLHTTRTIYPRVTLQSNITAKNISIQNQITSVVTKTNQSKDKIDAKPGVVIKEIVFRAINIAKPTIKRKPKLLNTLSDFHFRLKEDILSEPTQEYPDIFLRGVESKSTPPSARKSTTRYNPHVFTTETVTEHIGGVIPEFTKDYQNINFRAQCSDEGNSPKPLYLPKLKDHESLTKENSHESKNLTPKNMDTTKDANDNLKNENLRKIIAPSSYSLSDEETYLKVNLLDQLYHYNKTLHESEADKT